jgi:hypothetical protein
MERPKGKRQPVERRVTAEMMYLHDSWQNGRPAGDYGALSDAARQMYEEDAAALIATGGDAALLEVFEAFDKNRSNLSYSCEALANELLKFSSDYSSGSREDFEPAQLPHEVLAKISALRVGALLAGADEQLAIPSGPDGESTLDVRKQDAILTDAYLRVWKYADDRKYTVTSDPGVKPQYPRDYLAYPSSEKAYRYFIQVAFEYYPPTAELLQETLAINMSGDGTLSVERDIYVPGFGGAASEGYYVKTLDDATEEDIAAFADVIAEIVGDEPMPADSRNDYNDVKDYISRVPNGLTRAYLTEWLSNTSRSYVHHQLGASTPDGSTLREALMDPGDTDAHAAIITLVDYDRRFYNEQAQASGDGAVPWRDRVMR